MAQTSFGARAAGGKELRRDLRAVSKGLPSKVITPANRKAATLVLPAAKAAAPVGATGKLRKSVRVLASQRRAAVVAGSDRGDGPAFYARMVHRGTVTRRTRGGANRGRVAGNKFVYRAVAAVGDLRIVAVYEQELNRHLAAHRL